MKVSRKITLFVGNEKKEIAKELESCKEGTPARFEVEQKMFRYLRQLEKKEVEKNSKEKKQAQDEGYQKLLKYLWDSINAGVSEYKKIEKNPSKARFDSYMRLLQQGSQLVRGESSPAHLRYYKLAGLLLKELNVTEENFNKNPISFYTDVSTLAEIYMKIFCDNGIDPQDSLIEAFERENVQLQTFVINRFFTSKDATPVDLDKTVDQKDYKSPMIKQA